MQTYDYKYNWSIHESMGVGYYLPIIVWITLTGEFDTKSADSIYYVP